jgi:hypothetical protein
LHRTTHRTAPHRTAPHRTAPQSRQAEAGELYRRALQLTPDNGKANTNYGKLLFEQNDFKVRAATAGAATAAIVGNVGTVGTIAAVGAAAPLAARRAGGSAACVHACSLLPHFNIPPL